MTPLLEGDPLKTFPFYPTQHAGTLTKCCVCGPQESNASTKETGSAEGIPLVLRTWMLRDEWMKLQNNKACLNDSFQVPYYTVAKKKR